MVLENIGIENMMILCWNCHKYAPDHKEEFEEYMKEQCDGTMTTFLKAWKIIQEKHPELFNTQISNEQKRKVTSPLDTI